jgi:hypothetical protein
MKELTLETINNLVKECLNERGIFHSEADFQHALAWKIHEKFRNEYKIRLEFVIEDKHIDLVLIDSSDNKIGIELKYKTKKFVGKINEELYSLRNHGAEDCGRYDAIKDIERLEELVRENKLKQGFVIFLTNNDYYLNKCAGNACQFSLEDEKEITGKLDWGKDTGKGTKKGRENVLSLNGNYKIKWINSPNFIEKSTFKYFILEIHNK